MRQSASNGALTSWPSTTGILRYFGLMRAFEQFGDAHHLMRGQLTHAACHLLGNRQELTEDWEARHEECASYITAYRRFLVEHELKLMETEGEYVSHVHRFVSHPDQIGRLDGYGLCNLELKSGTLPACVALQTAGQIIAIGIPSMKRFCLQLCADGTYRLEQHEDFRDLDKFRALVESWWTIREYGVME